MLKPHKRDWRPRKKISCRCSELPWLHCQNSNALGLSLVNRSFLNFANCFIVTRSSHPVSEFLRYYFHSSPLLESKGWIHDYYGDKKEKQLTFTDVLVIVTSNHQYIKGTEKKQWKSVYADFLSLFDSKAPYIYVKWLWKFYFKFRFAVFFSDLCLKT